MVDKVRQQGQFNGPVNVGWDATGWDVKFYGDTADRFAMWDQSEDHWLVAGCTKLGDGGTTNHLKVDTSGCITLHGTGRVYRELWLDPAAWDVTNASAALGQFSSRFQTIAMNPLEAASGDVDIYVFYPAPNDIDTTACMRATALWSADAALATQTAEFTVNASMFGDGEVAGSTSYTGTAAKYTATASDANAVTSSSVMDDLDPPARGDLMGFHFTYHSAGSSTTGSDFQFHGVKIRYTANQLGEAT